MTATALEQIRGELIAEGGLLAQAVQRYPDRGEQAGWAALASSGPRVAGRAGDIAFAVAAVHEGYLLHYGTPTLLDAEGDPDLALLAGDRLYAMGLDRLAALGDLVAVAELADVIALCAQAHAAGDADLASAVWEAGSVAVGWGPIPELAQAKAAARAGAPGAAAALREAASRSNHHNPPAR